MHRIVTNILRSKSPLMVLLRSTLLFAIILMGVARLRITLILLFLPENYQQRDLLQIYLMSKAFISGMHPYLPLYELAEKFVGTFTYFPHPAPYPPFIVLLFIPLAGLDIKTSVYLWYAMEIGFLAVIAWMLTIIWKGKPGWFETLILFFVLLAWVPIMADLEVGQLSILLTMLLLIMLFALKRNKPILAGFLLGASVALKLITWPLIIYLIFKKDWRAVASSIITALILNLLALFWMGIGPFTDYYLRVSAQVLGVYHKFWANFSMYTIGYRLFEGTDSAIFVNNYHAPPLVSSPNIAPLVSVSLVAAFLVISMVWAIRSQDLETSFVMTVNLMVVISPIVWDHYYSIIIISLVVMLRNLIKLRFPSLLSSVYLLVVLLMFLFNDRIGSIMTLLNGGETLVEANRYQISFITSMISWLPLVEVIILTILLWRSGQLLQKIEADTSLPSELETDLGLH